MHKQRLLHRRNFSSVQQPLFIYHIYISLIIYSTIVRPIICNPKSDVLPNPFLETIISLYPIIATSETSSNGVPFVQQHVTIVTPLSFARLVPFTNSGALQAMLNTMTKSPGSVNIAIRSIAFKSL